MGSYGCSLAVVISLISLCCSLIYGHRLGEFLGSGFFGEVRKGVWHGHLGKLDVAVKKLKGGADEEQKIKFLQEAAIMTQFNHSNVVTMHGAVTNGVPVSS